MQGIQEITQNLAKEMQPDGCILDGTGKAVQEGMKLQVEIPADPADVLEEIDDEEAEQNVEINIKMYLQMSQCLAVAHEALRSIVEDNYGDAKKKKTAMVALELIAKVLNV
jgi:hypothetical protein